MIILVDTENVLLTISDIDKLNSESELVFFVSKNSKHISPYCLGLLDKNGIKYKFETVDYSVATKNCLDLHLVIYLTREIMSGDAVDDNDYFIYSKDADFKESAIYLESLTGVKVNTVCSLEDIKPKSEIIKEEKEDLENITSLCIEESSTLTEAYRYFVKTLRSKYTLAEISEIYKEKKEQLIAGIDEKKLKEAIEVIKDIGLEPISQTEINKALKMKDDKGSGLYFGVDKPLWTKLKGFLGYVKQNYKGVVMNIDYNGDAVLFDGNEFDFKYCNFHMNSSGDLNIGDIFKLKCIHPKESLPISILITELNQKFICGYINSIKADLN